MLLLTEEHYDDQSSRVETLSRGSAATVVSRTATRYYGIRLCVLPKKVSRIAC